MLAVLTTSNHDTSCFLALWRRSKWRRSKDSAVLCVRRSRDPSSLGTCQPGFDDGNFVLPGRNFRQRLKTSWSRAQLRSPRRSGNAGKSMTSVLCALSIVRSARSEPTSAASSAIFCSRCSITSSRTAASECARTPNSKSRRFGVGGRQERLAYDPDER